MKSRNRIEGRRGLIIALILLSLLLIALVIFAVWKERERTVRLANLTETVTETTPSTAAPETTTATTEPTAATELTENETESSATEESSPTEETGARQPDNSGGQQSEFSGSGGNGASGGNSSVVSSTVVSGSSSVATEPQPEVEIKTAQITCDKYSRFTGQYVEDGSDDLVYDVAAILVTNRSEQFLEIATFTYQIDGKNASFVVTGLPAGHSAWVMEENRITVADNSAFTYVDVAASFRDDVVASTSKVSVSADGNMMTVTNNSAGSLEDVYVYYKVRHTDGNYLGGITYRVDFGTLEAGASATNLAGHYSEDAEIVRIGWKTE